MMGTLAMALHEAPWNARIYSRSVSSALSPALVLQLTNLYVM
jgi:hypothetical protein